MDYKISGIKNGLRILTVPVSSSESLTATVWVKAGSRQEDPKISGLAHFLEHMAFKGGKNHSTAREISEIVDGMGAENNAGTSKEWTNFWIKTQSTNLERALEVLSDITINPILKQEEIDRERGVIYEELAMYEDTPMMSIGEYFEENLYGKSDLGRKIGGDRESLKNVNRPEFLSFRKKFYHPENMLVSIAGGFNPAKAKLLVEKYFSGLNLGSDGKRSDPEQIISKSQLNFGSNHKIIEADKRCTLKSKKSDQAHLMFGFMTEGRGYPGRFAQGILATILGRGMSSRLFIEVRERRGLAYAVRAGQERYTGVGNFSVYAGVALDKCEEAVKVISDQIYGIADKKYPVSAKELEKAKNSLKGRLALSLEDSSELGDFFAEQALFEGEIITPKKAFERVDKVKSGEIYFEARKMFNPGGAYLSLVGPYKDKSKFVKLI